MPVLAAGSIVEAVLLFIATTRIDGLGTAVGDLGRSLVATLLALIIAGILMVSAGNMAKASKVIARRIGDFSQEGVLLNRMAQVALREGRLQERSG